MCQWPNAPTFEDPATNGQIKFYALFGKEDEFKKILATMAEKHLPDAAKRYYFESHAYNKIEDLCALGCFLAHPIKVVIAAAFILEAVKAMKMAIPESKLPYPTSKPYWEIHNKLLHSLAQEISPEIGSDETAVFHLLYRFERIFRI